VKAQILVVEDDNIILMELCSRLHSLGYAIAAVASRGDEAIEKAISIGPDLVLMDIGLKGNVDGIEAAARIRTCLDVPIIFLTALADANTFRRAQMIQPSGYIFKPFEEEDLFYTIKVALDDDGQNGTKGAGTLCPATTVGQELNVRGEP
jgi:CheY-like chemotaxis protein